MKISQVRIPCLLAHPQEYVPGLAPPFDKACANQFFYVMGHGRPGNGKLRPQVYTGDFSACGRDPLENFKPSRICESSHDLG